ncbi:MAG: ribosomal protein S18-alanine N-acetyltransferase [Bacilli bacterium]|jgi:ribosomal-protein-alanine N-acetyltransferase|nr:ribosomal protein S18-alanine N-acetyltransferase [Bacilli bacterium]MDD3389003.1 ribosomal protein S18-alanine N-acetyltransferase [Bacilli bacterium]MDD4344442.1 ribosomal protein S18-alanine N-acetyltransferase [Bacilli bacterium]MDD4520654.1 ribosomal protein S18-alanine N-acetyltransferase [Bacilli bacterium]MDY0399371.1 ribosomal protein S18-alanine N-acetyltransferase [Bacilli bacterium]
MSNNEVNVVIRPIVNEDLDVVIDIEKASFNDPWTVTQFQYELSENPFATILVITYRDIVVGYIDFWITFESATINKIAIRNELRRFGLGKLLLEDTLRRITQIPEVTMITLEVRTHNEAAIKLYQRAGFIIDHTKKAYYSDGEDAYYMMKAVHENENTSN